MNWIYLRTMMRSAPPLPGTPSAFRDFVLTSSNLFGYWPLDENLDDLLAGRQFVSNSPSLPYEAGALHQAVIVPSTTGELAILQYGAGAWAVDPRIGSLSFMLKAADVTLYPSTVITYVVSSYDAGFTPVLIELSTNPAATGITTNIYWASGGATVTLASPWTYISEWAMLSVAWDATIGEASVYVNGTRTDAATAAPIAPVSSQYGNQAFLLWPAKTSRQTYFPRSMDEYVYWTDMKDESFFSGLYQAWQDSL